MSNVPLRSEMKATNFPSGEIAGFVSAPSKSVSRANCALESGFWTVGRALLDEDPRAKSRHQDCRQRPPTPMAARHGASARPPRQQDAPLPFAEPSSGDPLPIPASTGSGPPDHFRVLSLQCSAVRQEQSRGKGGGVAWMSFCNTSRSVVPVKGRSPPKVSYSTTPNEKMSLRESTAHPEACSGDMYGIGPHQHPGRVCPSVRVRVPPGSDGS